MTTAFNTLAELVGQPSYLLGGTKGALANGYYPTCVDKVFPKPGTMPQAAMVIEADFVVSEIVGNSPGYTAGTTGGRRQEVHRQPGRHAVLRLLPLPRPGGRPEEQLGHPGLRGRGDAVQARPRQAKALIKYLGSPEAGEIWAHLGGFASPNKMVPLSSYPDAGDSGRRLGAAARHGLCLQPGRPAGQLGAELVAGHAQLRQEPEREQHRLDRKDHAGAGHGRNGPLSGSAGSSE